ncbi:diaminopimelate epimerase [Roseivirga pacifica]|uniref:diaminopimelate epimerase n=1 Tax=Roseivirga pacifica TaxID=1267423 RepID=UPI00227C2A4A|nr:diaminopimelate epimerase [Roseivirga pacifica]
MRALSFYKYQGTGNDFVMVDNREGVFPKDDLKLIAQLCDRRFGIGADGVILIENAANADFEMVYYNPDGSQSLCGNGSRCAVMFAKQLGIIADKTDFLAIDGMHKATINGDEVKLLMNDVAGYEQIGEDFLIDTGSPHYIRYNNNVAELDMIAEGQSVRYAERFKAKGVNVNLIQQLGDAELKIRTYERGVEGETLSCGTGCTAAALSLGLKNNVEEVTLQAVGGTLKVTFEKAGNGFKNIYLIGPAKQVFAGSISI